MAFRTQTIGPYTLDKRLGAGGMGEVYQAYDQRLERWVAIKLIRAEAAASEKARERFRREARAAAGLSHPSIVQIFDILETEEGDAIVMELVEGESLGRRIGRGPLPVAEAVRLGREIAEGLAAAHARGIVHRDLKPDNVMIAAEGRAKILDFGLAKRLEGEASLTEDHRVIGTFRSMSPEQAKGLPLDARSDLFSLGILLYELLSGQSPFAGGSTLETLTRICTYRQVPAGTMRPEIPQGLSDLIDRLLEKDASRRPASAREVAAALANVMEAPAPAATAGAPEEPTWIEGPRPLGIAADEAAPPQPSRPVEPASASRPHAWLWIATVGAVAVLAIGLAVVFLRRPPEALYVAVPRPVVARSGGAEAELMASGVRMAILSGLASLKGVSPLAPEQVDPVPGPPAAVARAVAAGELITSALECRAEFCRISLRRILGKDGSVLWAQSFEAPLDRPYLLTEAVDGYLRQAYPQRQPREGAARLEVRPEDYAEFLRLRRAHDQAQLERPPADLLSRLEAIRRRSPHFLEAFLFEADILSLQFRSGRDPSDLERMLTLLHRARDLAPADPRPLLQLVNVALASGKIDEAEKALRELDRLQPADPGVMVRRARLLEARGETQRASDLMRDAVRRLPSWRHLYWAAEMELRLGHDAAGRGYLQELLRRFPQHSAGKSLLAQSELLTGSPQHAVQLYSDLVRRSPQFSELVNLGVAYMLLGSYAEAERRFTQAVRLEPKNPFATLNLADVVLLQGDRPRAAALYSEVLKLAAGGSSEWQLLTVRAQALAHLGRRREAAEAAQRALHLAADNAQALYEIALVNSLVGDRSSALVNAEKALAKGVEPRWFTFPWFDSLRSDAEFQDLLRTPATSRG